MSKTIGIGIIGLGFIGRVHAENINESSECKLAAVYDVDYKSMKSVAKKYRVQASKSFEDLVSNEKVDAIIIASPTVSHAEYLERAILFGKPILCEKPLTHDITKIRGICELIERKKIPVMMGFNRRFDKNYATLKKKIDRGDVGKVEMILITHRGPKLPPKNKLRNSGGQYLDSGSHFYDLLRWLTKDEVEEVFTFGTCLVDLDLNKWGDTDTSIILLRLNSGALCEMNFCRQTAYGYDDRIEVFGSDGLLVSERPRQDDVITFRKNKNL